MRLQGKTALITGAARGIGLEFARAYIAEGARVALADINADAVRAAVESLGPQAVAVQMDVTRQDSIDAGFAEVIGTFGHLDILVNNAALFTAAPVEEVTRADYDRVMAVNMTGAFFCMQAAAKHMIARGKGGKIINMASQAGRRGEPLVAVYCASKAAVISMTQSAGLGLIRHGINVNAIAPGVVDGEHWDMVDEHFARFEGLKPGEKKKLVGAAVPFGRMGVASDLTGMAIFLATAEAEYIVGQTFGVDGGNWLA
ncbi:L-iditol 2-dehydrogenase [Paracoccus denitrificans]|jgi:D-sorbitol dehydrogenase (acceptor)|uniref:Short-chain dehydrogenase/reductase SDR n=2 Tax=Paracoccus denitrificans (strain Pd 1222) TaxID=318586 RepID=A1BBK7_PARDP|nr:L-iditol 2-dehydrogenase [Paracoccus denitrificans]ABL72901.1 short-chain dehydrogenase/reductase SDR [Paracoccus denitrificans PD1222]MBB4626380.1 D-sorbitol dehydrogenase (acceptor) [Paracoccus denitrificans]MCU7427415.1 L-iditol 2-dehydrogenase [Paracoccus denitrificans]QAR29307.1 L-iditol 2-dehydrogenase [Paracoccus denitrificans]UPV98364.1 L-iditol 2-dehydrogenase [Paracoccus denitrificans]